MKKLILSSVFAGLVLASSSVSASTSVAPHKAAYGNFVINSKFSAGYWANVAHKSNANSFTSIQVNRFTGRVDGIDADDMTKRQLIALGDAKMTFKTEAGCAVVAFGTNVQLDMNAATYSAPQIFRDTYVFGRFGNMIEVRIGSQRDAMYSLVDAADVMGGTGGYNGSYGSLLKSTTIGNVDRRGIWMLDLKHANDTGFTNALEVRTTRLHGLQVVGNWKPSSAYVGRLTTYGDGTKVLDSGVQNNLVSLGLNYDNSFGDIRVRASAGGVYGLSSGLVNDSSSMNSASTGVEAATSATYRLGGIFSWKSFDLGLGWKDDRSTGFAKTTADNKNAGSAWHGALGYEFDTTVWKPRLSLGALWGWKHGLNGTSTDNNFENQNQTLAISAAVDLKIRDGFRWFVEGTWAMLDESNKTAGSTDKGLTDDNVIVGTGLAVTQ